MIVYHGSDCVVKFPSIAYSKKRLDFGNGFYVTTVKEQAERWAKRKALMSGRNGGIVNVYRFTESSDIVIKDFGDDLSTWIDFVCECRNGSEGFKQYDIIKGKVANDKVFRVVDMYKRGIWDKKRALQEIRVYKTYDQLAFISQKVLDKSLSFSYSFGV